MKVMEEIKRKAMFPTISLKGVTQFFIENRRILLMTVLFVVGLTLGAVNIKDSGSTVFIKFVELFNSCMEVQREQSLLSTFLNSTFKFTIYIVIIYICGLCAIGSPMICAVPLLRGLGVGFISGYLYSTYALKGLGYCLLILYPGLLVSVFAMFMCCNEGIMMSYDLLLTVGKLPTGNATSIKLYNTRFIVLTLINVAAAVIDTFFYAIFIRFFDMW